MRRKQGRVLIAFVGIFVCFSAHVTAAPPTHVISGIVATADGTGVEGVDVVGDNGAGSAITAVDGSYSIVVPNHWDGTVTVSKTGWLITPPSNTYTKVSADTPAQNYTAYQPKNSGLITKSDGTPLAGASVNANNGGGADTTDASGYYEIAVPYDWTGTVSVTLAGYGFTNKSYTNLLVDQTDQDFAGYQPTISGYVKEADGTPLEGAAVTSNNGGGSDTTDAMGYYEVIVPYEWSGAVSATLADYYFAGNSYTNVVADQANQYFSGFQPTISGSTDVAGATVTVSDVGSAVSTPGYSITVPYGWSGTAEATLDEYHFPESPRSYTNVIADQTNQDFTPFQPTISGSTDVAGTTVTVSGVGSVVSTPTYSVTVPYGWSGIVEASLAGYHFPESPRSYSSVTSNQTNQDFTAYQPIISGMVAQEGGTPLIGAIVTANNGGSSDTTDASGYYEIVVPYDWSGQVSAKKIKWEIMPESRSFLNVISHQADQDFTASYTGKIIVKADGSGDYQNIQSAINAAVNGDIIEIQAGTYTGDGNRDIDFKKKAITVRGATNKALDVIIDCQAAGSQSHRGFKFNRGESPSSILENLTIKNGNPFDDDQAYGGGIYCYNSSPTIHNCVIKNNRAGYHGGGIYCYNSSPSIKNCIITNNTAYYGGGVYCRYNSSPVIQNCTIIDNTAYQYYNFKMGGGLYCYPDRSRLYLENNIVWGNFPDQVSGIIYISYSNVQGGYSGTGNISLNPLLSPDGYHLLEDSPCINRGDPDYIPDVNEIDIEGDARVIGRIDIGADEFYVTNSPALYIEQDHLDFLTVGVTPAVSPQTLRIFNCGANDLHWSVMNTCDWLSIFPIDGLTGGSQIDEIVISINNNYIDYGVQSCQFQITGQDAVNSPQTVTVTLEVLRPVIHLSFEDYLGDPVNNVQVAVTGFDDPIIVNGTYDLTVPYGWTGTITPSKAEVSFVPDIMSFENVTQQDIEANFALSYYYSDGDGAENNPFQISNADDLRNLAKDPYNWDKYFVQTNEIDMGDPNIPNMETIAVSYPYRDKPGFSGVFDGQGFSIIHLNVDVNYEYSGGLFGVIGFEEIPQSPVTHIKNLTLKNAKIGQSYAYASGILVNYIKSGAKIENCIVEGGSIYGDGGLAGSNDGSIDNCHAINCYVESYRLAGGLVGTNYGVISNCSASGTVIGSREVGGLAGISSDTKSPYAVIENCSAQCTVQSTDPRDDYSTGGLIGKNSADVTGCSAAGDVTGTDCVGGLIG